MEYSLVLVLMLLLSPMSSKPHFCTLVVPGLCLARLAVERRDRLLMCVMAVAIGAGLLSNKDLWGAHIYDFALWYGSVFANAVVLYLGCVYALWRYRAVADLREHTASSDQGARHAA